MTKAWVEWEHRDVLESARENESITDYITPGLCILDSSGEVSQFPFASVRNPWHFSPLPYDPNTCIYDTLRVIACWRSAGGGNLALEWNLNAGVGAWTALTLPITVTTPCGTPWSAGLGAVTTGAEDVALGAIGAATWIGLRFWDSVGAPTAMSWTVKAIMYDSTDTPF